MNEELIVLAVSVLVEMFVKDALDESKLPKLASVACKLLVLINEELIVLAVSVLVEMFVNIPLTPNISPPTCKFF